MATSVSEHYKLITVEEVPLRTSASGSTTETPEKTHIAADYSSALLLLGFGIVAAIFITLIAKSRRKRS